MAHQADKKQVVSPRTKKSFIPAPKIYSTSKSVPATSEPDVKEKKFLPGDRVCISGIKKGIVLYFGKLHVSDGLWCGIELDDPEGLNDGQIENVRYFSCKPSHGIFAPIEKVDRISHPTGKSYTTWSKVSNAPVTEKKTVETDSQKETELHKSPLTITYENHEDSILEEQPPFELPPVNRKSTLTRAPLKNQFEQSKLQQSYQPHHHQQQQQNTAYSSQYNQHPQNQPSQNQQQQFYQYTLPPAYNQQQYASQQYLPQQQVTPPQYTQHPPHLQPQYHLQQIHPYPQTYSCQHPSYSNQQSLPLSHPQEYQQPIPLQQQHQQPQQAISLQPQQQHHQQALPLQQQHQQQQQALPLQQQQQALPLQQQHQQQQQALPLQQQQQALPLQQQHQQPQQAIPLQQGPLHQQQQYQTLPAQSYHQQVGPIAPPLYQHYQQLPAASLQDQYQQQTVGQSASPKHSPVFNSHDKPSDGFSPDGGGGGGVGGGGGGGGSETNGIVLPSGPNPTDIEFSASVKEYLESDRRTYFNFTFDGDSGSSRSTSTIPDSLTSSAFQAEQDPELDLVGAIWELENTDDEASFRLEEAISESSSLTASTEEKQLAIKLEDDGNTHLRANYSNTNSLAPPTPPATTLVPPPPPAPPAPPALNDQNPLEEILIQRLEKELQENIAKKENYYKTLARQSSRERDGKDAVDGHRSKKDVKRKGHTSESSSQGFSNILDSGYEPDSIKQSYSTIASLTESIEDEVISKKAPPPIMTDSGIIVREEAECGHGPSDGERLEVSGTEFSLEHLSPNDQLAADLRNGHKDKERPVSLISTTSVDTGYVPDTDSEVGTVMNSPVEKLNTIISIKGDLEGEAASIQDKTDLGNFEIEPMNHEDKDFSERNILNENDDRIKADKDVEKQGHQADSDGPLKGNDVEDNKQTDIPEEEDSSSQEQRKETEAEKDNPASKSKKNATNKEKAGSSPSETRARSKSTDRKSEQESRSKNFLSETKNFQSETKSKQEKIAPKLIKRTAPKSKWDTIMNKIENNKENVKLKPKTEVKSKLESYLSQKPAAAASSREKKVTKEAAPKKVTHIPLPDYSRVKSKLFSATASSATKQRPVNKKTDVENVLQEMPETIGSSTVSINSVVSSKSNQSAMGTSGNQTTGKVNQLHKQTKSDKGKIRSKVVIKTERPGSASSSKTDATQNSVKSMNTRNVGQRQTADKNVNSKTTTQISSRKSVPTKPPISGRVVTNVTKQTLNQGKVSEQNKLNNNRNTKGKVSSLKTSTDKASASKEINRLEVLCESRTKDLNYTKLQLKSSLTAFDAMAVIVNYLANELDAFACPSLAVKLTEVQKELNQGEEQIEKLKTQQAKLEQDILECNKQHENALTDLVNAQSTSLLNQKELLTQQNTENIRKVQEDHAKEVDRIKRLQAEKKSDLTAEHKNNMDNLRLTHLEEIRILQGKHENQMEDLHRQHRDKLEEITHTFESIKMTLSEKVESLRCECEEFRNRARMCEEALEQEANVRVQTALSPYRDLPREIESLKTVLEMRNQEIHDLRNHKIDLEKQLEELPPAMEKITLLQQKIENLEAILQIKSDHEKQLNEKCQSLMRKFNKETRANKRLSMEFDELKWRMSQSELSGSQENILKMYSCSPSGSESGSPDPTRRFSRSPKHWDHRDGGGDQLSSSVTGDGSMESKVKRRSGTFIVHDRPSPLSSPKSKPTSGSPAIQMSQSWAGTGEPTTAIPSPEESKSLTLSPPKNKSLSPPENSLSFPETSTVSVNDQPSLTESMITHQEEAEHVKSK